MGLNNISPLWAVVPAAVLSVLLLAGWYFVQPLPFPGLERCDRVEATCIQLSPGLIEDNAATLLPASSQWVEVRDLLDSSSYRRCWDTLWGTTSTGNPGARVVMLFGYSSDGDLVLDLIVTSRQKIYLNGRIYEMGWFGASSAAELVQELSQTLGFVSA